MDSKELCTDTWKSRLSMTGGFFLWISSELYSSGWYSR